MKIYQKPKVTLKYTMTSTKSKKYLKNTVQYLCDRLRDIHVNPTETESASTLEPFHKKMQILLKTYERVA